MELFLLCLVQAETVQTDLTPEQQAKKQITVEPFSPFRRDLSNYLYISSGTNKVSVGNKLLLQLSISTSEPTVRENIKHITYVVRQQHRASPRGMMADLSPPDCTFPPWTGAE